VSFNFQLELCFGSYAYVQKTTKLCDLWEATNLFCFEEEGAILPASKAPVVSLEKRCGKPMIFSHQELSSSLARYFFSAHIFLSQRAF